MNTKRLLGFVVILLASFMRPISNKTARIFARSVTALLLVLCGQGLAEPGEHYDSDRHDNHHRSMSVYSTNVLALVAGQLEHNDLSPSSKLAPLINDKNGNSVYLVTVPLVGQLIKDILGGGVEIMVISDKLDYHGPRVTPHQLQDWRNVSHIFWFGAQLEPQMAGIIRKVSVHAQAQVVELSVGGPSSDAPASAVQADIAGVHEEHKEDRPESVHRDIHKDGHSYIHKLSTVSGRLEPRQDVDNHTHHHHHDPSYAHPWLSVDRVLDWARFILGFAKNHQQAFTQADLESVKQRHHAWSEAFDSMLIKWRLRFAQLDNRAFVQEHAALEPLALAFDLESVGALTTHHDTAASIKQLLALRKSVQENDVRCFVALPNSQVSLPPSLFAEPPRVTTVDPLGANLDTSSDGSDFASVSFFSTILASLYGCLSGEGV